jgi:hypothetical protein
MELGVVKITLAELQSALNEYCFAQGKAQPDTVQIVSYGKVKITVDLHMGGIVEAVDFKHRSVES